MDRKNIFEMYGKYYDPIHTLASTPLLDSPTVDKVFNNKSLIQSAYRDMKDIGFRGTSVEFIGWLSVVYLVDSLKREVPSDATMLDWAMAIIDSYDKYKIDCFNFYRLWSYYLPFNGVWKAAVKGLPYPVDSEFEEDWGGGSTETVKEWMRVNMAFSAFGDLMIYEQAVGKKRDDHDELVDFTKKLATTEV